MDLDAIIRLMERAEQSAFSKIEVQQGDLRILLERGAVVLTGASAALMQPQQSVSIQPDDQNAVRSPISSVFYLAKKPGAAPFVQVGSKVEKGDTLCIIEAMKTMNDIRAPRSGIITAILAVDGATLAAGDALFFLGEGN
ncbi:MAG: acetyl-CoA carboxylase biotin carboxyl carrier protein subunit [Eubacteriales bacterium]|nr:acetyl-CoA carboxylase biotin carboxyl carrier protein subunit [Eubacteriales bacterium]